MMLPFVKELNEAIQNKRYNEVKEMLANPNVPVSIDICYVKLLIRSMLQIEDPEMAQLFLACPRIDWLALHRNRNLLTLEQDYGIKYVPDRSRGAVNDNLDYFSYLGHSFEQKCPEEAQLIYERIIEEIVKITPHGDRKQLLLLTCKSLIAFKVALKYNNDFQSLTDSLWDLLECSAGLEILQLLHEMGADFTVLKNANRILPSHTVEVAYFLYQILPEIEENGGNFFNLSF